MNTQVLQRRLGFGLSLLVALAIALWVKFTAHPAIAAQPVLLSDPFLQAPTPSSVQVVWFTEFPGTRHTVSYGANLRQTAVAQTTQMSRMREDQNSKALTSYTKPTMRPVWRHEAIVSGLRPNQRLPYRVTSMRQDGQTVSSGVFSLAASPAPGQPVKILLTSDHQLKPMAAANLQKAVETVGSIDAVFFAGDLVDFPDRTSEWFDDSRGGAFFPVLQGRAQFDLERNGSKTRYRGGAVIQSAPLYTAIGNHEVMGEYGSGKSLGEEYSNTRPRVAAEVLYAQKAATVNPTNDPSVREIWIKNHSFNTDSYEELFTLPTSPTGGERYYATTIGDVRLVVLYATAVWRPPFVKDDVKGKYQERSQDLANPEQWGYGQHLYEPIAKGSPQYTWLQRELNSSAFKAAKYKVVMLHQPPHSLGDNSVPAYTDPIQQITQDGTGVVRSVRYRYPKQDDYLMQDVVPLLRTAQVNLVLYGHSHLWNRFIDPTGIHFLETSNVGNSYGAYITGGKAREVPKDPNYIAVDDPYGLPAIVPTIAPLSADNKTPLPYIASNDITVFTILDTGRGVVTSYRFDTRIPNGTVVKFDQFTLERS